MKKLTIILLLIVPMVLKAQVPGYQGKRLIVYYNLGVASNFIKALYFPYGYTYPLQFHLCHNLDAEYILSRKFSLEGEFSFLENKPNEFADISSPIYGSSVASIPIDMVSTGFGVNCVFYPGSDNAFAPIGNFFKLKLGIKSYTATGMTYSPDSLGNSVQSKKSVTGSLYMVGMEFGHHLVVKDKFVLSASLALDVNLPSSSSISDDGVSVNVYEHMLFTYLIYLKFGIGGLLY